MMQFISHSEEETQRAAAAVARCAFPGMFIALWGGLGAGKTAFVRGLAAELGVSGRVRSPSFEIVHEHPGTLSLYRLQGGLDEGLEDYFYAGGVCAVEWPQYAGEALPEHRLDVQLEFSGEERILRFTPLGEEYIRAMEGWHL